MSFFEGLAEGLRSGVSGAATIHEIRRRNRLDLLRENELREQRELREQERQLSDERQGIVRGVTHPDQLPDPQFDAQPGLFDGTNLSTWRRDQMGGPADVGGVRLGMQPDEGVPDLRDLSRASFISEIEGRLADRKPVVVDTPFAYRDPTRAVASYMQSPEGQVAVAERDAASASSQSFQKRVRELAEAYPDQATLFALAEDDADLRDILEGHVPGYQPIRPEGSGRQPGDLTANQVLGTLRDDERYANYDESGFFTGWRFPVEQVIEEARRIARGEPPTLVSDAGQGQRTSGRLTPRQLGAEEQVSVIARWITQVEQSGLGESQRRVLVRFLQDQSNTLREKQRAMAEFGVTARGPGEDTP